MNYFESSKEYLLKKSVNLWVVIATLLLLSNLILSMLCWYTVMHQKIEITPFFGGSRYSKSASSVDAQYLDLMSINFIFTRLNVTPNNIKQNHARLLRFVDSHSYHAVTESLLREEKQVIEKQVSSYFDIKSVRSKPRTLKTIIHGNLRRFVGLRELPAEKVFYELQYNYHLGELALVSFEKKEEPK